MITNYIAAALRRARYQVVDRGHFCATVPGLRGVIATAPTVEGCRAQHHGNPVALTPGTRLGPYEIVSALGAGGISSSQPFTGRPTTCDRLTGFLRHATP